MLELAGTVPSFEELWALAGSGALADRAFAASALQLQQSGFASADGARIYERIQSAARGAHAELRSRLAKDVDARCAFLAELETLPLELRDHWIEEVLDIAYPPLAMVELPAGSVSYSPSGWEEVRFLLRHANLEPGKKLVDLGSGLGKVVLLAALLTGARAEGVELDPALVEAARRSAQSLGLERAQFRQGDVAASPPPEADVYYMFIPLQRSRPVLQGLAAVARRRQLSLFAQGLDLTEAPWLRRTGNACYWLEHFESH